MNLRQALTFLTVAELGAVSKAALRLRVAQPALSRQIIALEQELGLRLFDRLGRRLLLTGEGEQLIAGCRLLLNSASSLKEQAQLLRHGDTGVLKIAGSPQHIESVLSQFLHRYAQRYPGVEIKIREGTGSEILTMLERGEVHLGQNLLHAVRLNEQNFGSLALGSVQLLAVCHPSMSRNPHTLLALAEAGHGVAIVPSQLQCMRYKLRIVGLTLRRRLLQEPLTISWDKRRPLPRFAADYCTMIAAHMRETFPITGPSEPPSVGRRRSHRPGAKGIRR
jgi:DNA-binding transcriptional LysR family regulator